METEDAGQIQYETGATAPVAGGDYAGKFVNNAGYSFGSRPDGMVQLALDDIRKSGLEFKTLHEAGVRLFNGTKEQLKSRLGRSTIDGHYLNGCFRLIEFPYYACDGSVQLYRYKVIPHTVDSKTGREIKYLHPIGAPAIPYVPHSVWEVREKVNKPLWITEGEKKCLKLLQHGRHAIALSGVFNFKAPHQAGKSASSSASGKSYDTELWAELQAFRWQGRTVYIAFDADLWVNPMVRAALYEFALRLYSLGAVLKFPLWAPSEGKGIDDYLGFCRVSGIHALEEELDRLQESAAGFESFVSADHEEAAIRALSIVHVPPLKYQRLMKVISRRLNVSEKALAAEVLRRTIDIAGQPPEYSEEEKQAALTLLQDPALLTRYLELCHTQYLGRDGLLVLVKLATVSRKFKRGIPVILTGTASVGKSALINTVLQTVWPADKEDFSRISESYFLYRREPLEHKVITFYETHGSHRAAYILRTALSEGVLRLGTVVKDGKGSMVSADIEKPCDGLVLLSTFASDTIDWELTTRVIKAEITHDETLAKSILKQKGSRGVTNSPAIGSADQAKPFKPFQTVPKGGGTVYSKATCGWTQTVPSFHEKRDDFFRGDDEGSFRLWQVADHLIEPLEVIVPYGETLADMFPTNEERYLRDFDKVLALIKASALLHQYQRKKDESGCVIANEYDYETVYGLKDIITQSVSMVHDNIISFLRKVGELTLKEGEESIFPTREDIEKALNISKTTIHRYTKEALNNELMDALGDQGGRGKKVRYRVLSIPEMIYPLPAPEKLFHEFREPMGMFMETRMDTGCKPFHPPLERFGTVYTVSPEELREGMFPFIIEGEVVL